MSRRLFGNQCVLATLFCNWVSVSDEVVVCALYPPGKRNLQGGMQLEKSAELSCFQSALAKHLSYGLQKKTWILNLQRA